MIERPQHTHAARADTIAHRQQLFIVVDIEGDVLHGTRRAGFQRVAGMGHAELGRNVLDCGRGDEGHAAVRIEFHEAVKISFHTMHPVQSFQFHAEHIREEFNLCLDVGGHDREVMNTVQLRHAEFSHSFV